MLLHLAGHILKSVVDFIYKLTNPLTRIRAKVLFDRVDLQLKFLCEIVKFLLDALNLLFHLRLEELLALVFIAGFEECLSQAFHASGAEVWVVDLKNRLMMLRT